MEQQQNELFAMIGELTYRLSLAKSENASLIEANNGLRHLKEEIASVRKDNEKLKEREKILSNHVKNLSILNEEKLNTIQTLEQGYSEVVQKNNCLLIEVESLKDKNSSLSEDLSNLEDSIGLYKPIRESNRSYEDEDEDDDDDDEPPPLIYDDEEQMIYDDDDDNCSCYTVSDICSHCRQKNIECYYCNRMKQQKEDYLE